MIKSPTSNKQHIFVVVLGCMIAYLPSYIHRIMTWTNVQIGPSGPPSTMIWNWLAVVLLLCYIAYVERRRLISILLTKPSQKDIEWAFWFWGISTTVTWTINTLFPPEANQGMDTLLSYPLPVVIGIIVTAAITEEILFRGYPIERIKELTGKAWFAVAISFTIFILPHITFFGISWLLYHGIGTVMLYVLYVWRKNLYACMILHLLGNLPILLPILGLV